MSHPIAPSIWRDFEIHMELRDTPPKPQSINPRDGIHRSIPPEKSQVPKMTLAIHNFVNAGLRSGAQLEFIVMIG
jgi:hypothetical protein